MEKTNAIEPFTLSLNYTNDELTNLKYLRDFNVREFWNLARNPHTTNQTLYALLSVCVDPDVDNGSQYMAARFAAMNLASRQLGKDRVSWDWLGWKASGGHFTFPNWDGQLTRIRKPNNFIHLDNRPR
jgi:hypothetical protein